MGKGARANQGSALFSTLTFIFPVSLAKLALRPHAAPSKMEREFSFLIQTGPIRKGGRPRKPENRGPKWPRPPAAIRHVWIPLDSRGVLQRALQSQMFCLQKSRLDTSVRLVGIDGSEKSALQQSSLPSLVSCIASCTWRYPLFPHHCLTRHTGTLPNDAGPDHLHQNQMACLGQPPEEIAHAPSDPQAFA
ncbi:uncharacterized protein VTP21DRAFT_9298 [Calcarisporiella thermophila]|uniref:uncharacterized protein n=1 Tax=Calcarisporiella thermophila TaxID=911321 RepID=UPI003743ABC8